MHKSLRSALWAGSVVVATVAATLPVVQASAAVACAPAWSATTVYNGGNKASYQGINYRAKWWTQNENPATHSQEWAVWAGEGACSDSPTDPPTSPPTTPPTDPPTTPPTDPPTDPGARKVVGYFAQWGVYGRQYFVKNIVSSGSASKLTHILYAFGNVSNGQCTIGDSYADYDMAYTTANSVDGVADTWDNGALRGNFNQLRKLKRAYPNIKIIWSFGGWTWSGGFGQAAQNPGAFADSCYNLVKDSRWSDVFDGIDIDWEYPGACGNSCDNSPAPAYKNLMSALSSKFKPHGLLVTSAITADGSSGGKMEKADYAGGIANLDFVMLMTYDYYGAFSANGPTAPHSPLTSYPGIPTTGFWSDAAVQKLKGLGVPAGKILLGVGFYGRGWTGVTQAAPGGSATGPAEGIEPGVQDYKVLKNSCPPTGTIGGTSYSFCGNNWWSYDTPQTIGGKMTYVKNQGLGGAFFWEFSGDTSNGELISAVRNNL